MHINHSVNTSWWLRMLVSHRTTSMQAKNLPPSVCQKNVTRLHTRILHVKTTDLLESLLLDPIDLYICKRHLRWTGHMFRILWNHLPRKMLTSWVCFPRPRGCPKMTYGRSLKKSLKKSEMNIETWQELALDRSVFVVYGKMQLKI